MEKQTRVFNITFWSFSLLVLALVVLRCAVVPFSHDEVATFYYYVQSGDFWPFLSHPDANGHFLMSLSSWVCFKIFGSSTLALRIPCILSFMILVYAVFRLTRFTRCIFSNIFLASAFILSFHFVAFYSLCRGYGISMAFLTLAFYYFLAYSEDLRLRHLVKFILFAQIALSANLTLVFVLGLSTVFILIWQLRRGVAFKPANLIVLIVHLALLAFWVKYAFFLKESGALYYGGGESYWEVTFSTLIETIAFKNKLVTVTILFLFLVMCVCWVYWAVKGKWEFVFRNYFSISFLMLSGLIVAFYLLKKLLGVNYPEDRTGLFFYVFFILSLVFMIPQLRGTLQPAFMLVPLFFGCHLLANINISVHPWRVYETIPESFFETLKEEQSKTRQPITVGGHRVREFFYGFLNYNSEVKLSHITAPEALQMNCDYALAYAQDKPYYDPYYTELATDKYWDFKLLKRKQPIERILLKETSGLDFVGEYEYYNALELLDTTFATPDPLVAEFDFSVEKTPVPFNAWLVLQIDGDTADFVRTPLALVKNDWNGTQQFRTCLVTGNIPVKIKRLVAYLWNIDKKEIKIRLNSFRLYKLKGEGIREVSKAKI